MSKTTSPAGDQNEHALEILQANAQTFFPASSCEDTFRTWQDIVGNTKLKESLQHFVARTYVPNMHYMVYGANRSAKTSTVNLALQAKFCRQRDAALNPCQKCNSCMLWLSGAVYRNGLYFNGAESFEYIGVNCHDIATFDEDKVLGPREQGRPLVLFLDEVASSAFRPIIPKLLKPMMELPMTVITCSVRVKSVGDEKTGKVRPGLPPDFWYRFTHILKTTTVSQEPFLDWLRQRCAKWSLRVDEPEALELIRQRSLSIPGQALRPLRKAQFLGVAITKRFVEDFRWDPE